MKGGGPDAVVSLNAGAGAGGGGGGGPPAGGYITTLDKDGNIKEVPVGCDESGAGGVGADDLELAAGGEAGVPEANPLADFMSTDILTKPFNFVAGSATKSRFNPFRKKSGLLNVLARQSTRNRIVGKNGGLNIINSAEGKSHKFFKDIFISIIDLNWGWIFFMFAAAFFLSWLGFAVIWYGTFYIHGDFDPDNLERAKNKTFRVCADNIEGFTSCFLFSLETQHTIGYGGRATTEECPFAIIVMSLQSILGVIIQACMAGIIFAKFTVPRARGETIVYSKNAVITKRNGALYLLCRVSDLRKSSLLEAHVRMVCIKKEITEEGEVIPYQQSDLECGSESDGTNDRVLILWPTTIAHKIDEESPFWEMGPRDLLGSHFEVIVTLEGVTEETGNTIQVRTSYLPNEILWGHHFDNNILNFDKKISSWVVAHYIINKTETNDTPRISAKQLDRRKRSSSNRHSSAGVSVTSDSRSEESPNKHRTISILSSGNGGGGGTNGSGGGGGGGGVTYTPAGDGPVRK